MFIFVFSFVSCSLKHCSICDWMFILIVEVTIDCDAFNFFVFSAIFFGFGFSSFSQIFRNKFFFRLKWKRCQTAQWYLNSNTKWKKEKNYFLFIMLVITLSFIRSLIWINMFAFEAQWHHFSSFHLSLLIGFAFFFCFSPLFFLWFSIDWWRYSLSKCGWSVKCLIFNDRNANNIKRSNAVLRVLFYFFFFYRALPNLKTQNIHIWTHETT